MRDVQKVLGFYKKAATVATQGLLGNPLLLALSVLAALVFGVAATILMNFGLAGGMLLGLVEIALLSYFYSWISAVLDRNKLTLKNFYEFDYSLFFAIISVAFIFYIAQLLVQSGTAGLGSRHVILFLNLAIVFLFNAIPEVIVVLRYESLPALGYALNFVRDNFIPWFAPLLVIVAPLVVLSPESALVFFANSEPLLPTMFIFKALKSTFNAASIFYLAVLLATVGSVWFTLFRMHLFKLLDGTAR